MKNKTSPILLATFLLLVPSQSLYAEDNPEPNAEEASETEKATTSTPEQSKAKTSPVTVSAPAPQVVAVQRIPSSPTQSHCETEALQAEVAKLNLLIQKQKAEAQLKAIKDELASKEQAEKKAELAEVQMQMAIAKAKAEAARYELACLLEKQKCEDLKKLQEKIKAFETSVVYLENPFSEYKKGAVEADKGLKDGVLTISDRRIPFNGVVTSSLAEVVERKIEEFNNDADKGHFPIFLVIDSSPGGSVSAGFRILNAMDESKAPVYVVVKSFAASMAAFITTYAEKSFVQQNARILHHQISGGAIGTLTDIDEAAAEMHDWWERLARKLADRMGIGNLNDLRAKMFEASRSGDWTEFSDEAQGHNWVDYVAEIHETSFVPQFQNSNASSSDSHATFVFGEAAAQDLYAALDPAKRPELNFDGEKVSFTPRDPDDKVVLYDPTGRYKIEDRYLFE